MLMTSLWRHRSWPDFEKSTAQHKFAIDYDKKRIKSISLTSFEKKIQYCPPLKKKSTLVLKKFSKISKNFYYLLDTSVRTLERPPAKCLEINPKNYLQRIWQNAESSFAHSKDLQIKNLSHQRIFLFTVNFMVSNVFEAVDCTLIFYEPIL